MSRAEIERKKIQEAGSPSAHHSMNQSIMGLTYAGERRMTPSRKAARIETRIEKRRNAYNQYEKDKFERILSRVDVAFQGDERVRLEILKTELRFLERRGIPVPYPGSLYQEDLEIPGTIEWAIAVTSVRP